MSGALVIGYGNVLRTDDGVGPYAATALAASGRLPGAAISAAHQLTPELALDVNAASLVVLIDAGPELAPGTFSIGRVEAGGRASPSSHVLDPGDLVDLTLALYGGVPDVFVVSVGVASVDLGDELSPEVHAGVPALLDAVVDLVVRSVAEPSRA